MSRSEQGDNPFGDAGGKMPPKNPDAIAMGLQQLFATVADEPVPDEFLALLERIDAQEDARRKPAAAPAKTSATGQSK